MPTHSTLLAWKIPWAEEPEEPGGGVMWSKELDTAEHTRARAHTHTHTHTHTVRKPKFREISPIRQRSEC